MHAFTSQQRSRLLANKNVHEITEKNLYFTPAFKLKAVKQYLAGKQPNQIFFEADIPIEYFKPHYCRCCIKKWFKKFKTEGEDSLLIDKRGQGSTGRPKVKFEKLTYDELLALVEIQKGALEELKKKKALVKKKF